MQRKSRGMTLIEVLVAFVVLSLTMAVLLKIFSGGMHNASLANSYSRAVFLAESKLAAAGVEQPLADGESTGQVGVDLRWRVSVIPLADVGGAEPKVMRVQLYKVLVRVDWSEDGRERQIQLNSLRLGPAQ